ncbi:hypothetical protein N9444_00270 [Gammaproteobacteria bacterium]|nr:hypothetical protein [Gammaproteobacteria bacterium]
MIRLDSPGKTIFGMHPGVLKLQIKLVRAPSILDLYIDLKQVFEHGKLASELWLVLP